MQQIQEPSNLNNQLESGFSNEMIQLESEQWTLENTFIFVILGNCAIMKQNSGHKKIKNNSMRSLSNVLLQNI